MSLQLQVGLNVSELSEQLRFAAQLINAVVPEDTCLDHINSTIVDAILTDMLTTIVADTPDLSHITVHVRLGKKYLSALTMLGYTPNDFSRSH